MSEFDLNPSAMMSVRDRIEDSKLLFNSGRLEGAMLSVLLAVAATSRKRYPKLTDRKAFERFLADERKPITDGREVEVRGKMLTLESILYKFVRNHMVHEGELEDHFSFDYGDFLLDKRGTTDYFTFSSELVVRLAFIVEKAPENEGVFPDGRYDHLPEPTDLKHSAIIKYRWGDQDFEIFCSAISVQRELWDDTGEMVDWLHVKGTQSFDGRLSDGPGVKLLIPVMYVTRIDDGPRYKRTRRRSSCNVGVFPPEKAPPSGAMDLQDIKCRVAELQIPMVESTITLRRPFYEGELNRVPSTKKKMNKWIAK